MVISFEINRQIVMFCHLDNRIRENSWISYSNNDEYYNKINISAIQAKK
jgi:hypothetical protein